MNRAKACSVLFFFILSFQVTAQQISIYKTRKMDLIYPGKGIQYLVPHTARCFENAFSFHEKFWDYHSKQAVTILFNDFTDIGNGGARVSPNNFINIAVSPFDYTFDVLPANERMQWLMSHENTHVVMCDKPARSDILYRKIFQGKILTDQENPITMLYSYLTTPRWYSPRWYHEGIAIFMETWMSGGMGRTLGSYDEMVFRAMVRDSAYFYRPIGLETEGTAIDFQVGVNAYLYGTRFDSYLALKYGTTKLRDFYSRSDSSRRFFARQFKKVYGKSLSEEWDAWVDYEHQHQQNNLDKIRQYPVTPTKKITPIAMGSMSRMYFDKKERKIYAAVNYPKKMAHLCSIDLDKGTMEKMVNVSSPGLYYVTNLAFDDSTKTLFLTNKNNNWRGLISYNLKTGRKEKLFTFLRAGDLAFSNNDRCLYGIQHMNGRTSIIRLLPPYKQYNTLYNTAFGYSLFNLDVSPNGEYLSATLADMNGKQKLVLFKLKDLIAGKSEYSVLYEFEDNTASNFTFTNDSRSLLGTSYYTGVSNVYRISIEKKNFELLTNAETGFFRPIEVGKDSLLVLEYLPDGLQPCLITVHPLEDASAIDFLGQKVFQKNPEVENWMLPKLSKINVDSLVLYEGKYNSFKFLDLTSAYPIVVGYKDDISLGYQFNLMDKIGYNALKFNVSYSPGIINDSLPEKEKVHASFDYNYINFSLSGTYNNANFYDLFGPTKFSRAGYTLSLTYRKNMSFYSPWTYGYMASVTGYWDLEKLPSFQNINATEKTLYTTMVKGSLSRLRKSLGATDYEQGFDWKIWVQGNYVSEQFFPSIFSTFDLGFLLPWKNSSFWIKTAVGQGFAERENPFSNFYFGSFGYNYLDTRSGGRQLNREIWGFPGLDIDQVGGKNFARVKLETYFSPIRFKKVGFLWFYITYVRLNVFGSGLMTNFDIPEDKLLSGKVYNSGAQLDFELVLFSLMKSTLSTGVARAYRQDMKPRDEFMVTLRLL